MEYPGTEPFKQLTGGDASGYDEVSFASDGTIWAISKSKGLWYYREGEWIKKAGGGDHICSDNGITWHTNA